LSESKDAYWFSHDSNASNDPNIVFMRSEHGWKGYGLYWAIVERMRDMADYNFPHARVKALAYDLREDDIESFIAECIDKYRLFESDGEYFWSASLKRRMARRDAEKIRRHQKAATAANARWNNEECDGNADALPEHLEADTEVLPELCSSNAQASARVDAQAMPAQCLDMLEQNRIGQESTEEDIKKDTHKDRAREAEPPGHDALPSGDGPIEDVVFWDFEKANGGPFVKPDKQREKIAELITLARVRGDPVEVLHRMIFMFQRLKATDDFYKKQPLTPAVMVSLWEKIYEHLRNWNNSKAGKYKPRAPDPDAKKLKIEEGGMMKVVREKRKEMAK